MAHSLHTQHTLPMHISLAPDNTKLLENAAKEYYGFQYQFKGYHNWEHARHVMDSATLIMSAECPDIFDESILLAAMWHDAVYIAGSGEAVNEHASAAALNHNWNHFHINDDPMILQRATRLITMTSIGTHLISQNITNDLPHQILMDADLSSLAAKEYNDFKLTQGRIIMENNGDPTSKDDKHKCSKFLLMLSNARPYIYHTTTARNWYEAKALSNIARYAEENKL